MPLPVVPFASMTPGTLANQRAGAVLLYLLAARKDRTDGQVRGLMDVPQARQESIKATGPLLPRSVSLLRPKRQ